MSGIELPELPVEKFTLANGLTVIMREDHSSPVVSLQTWCQTGSIHEGEFLGAGLSHILEHMLFKGTEQRHSDDIARDVSAMGGQINAYTSFDRTVYYIDCPAESSDGCLEVLMDVVGRATIPGEEFAREQEVIRREFSMGRDDPERVASQEMFATCFQVHPYGVPVIGYLENFNEVDRSNVVSYYQERYAPNNMFLVIVGDFDAGVLSEKITSFFGDFPRRSVAPVFVPEEPEQLGRRDTFVEFSTPISKLWLAWKIPGITHPDMAALDVLAVIIGEGRSSRLYRAVREDLGAVYRIDAFSYTPASAGLFAIGANLDAEKRTEAEKGIIDQVNKLKDDGVSADEIEKARHMALVAQLDSLITMEGQASDLGSNWTVARSLSFTREYLRRVSEVDETTVVEVARRYLVDASLSVIEVGSKQMSETPTVIVGGGSGKTELFELGNGLKLCVEEDHRLPLVSVSSAFKAGLLADDLTHSGLTALVSRTLLQGTASRSAKELAESIESVGGNAYTGAGNNCFYVNAEVMSQDVETALNLVCEVLISPEFPEEAVNREKQSQIAAIEQELDSPVSVATATARKALFGDHPYGRMRLGDKDAVSLISCEQLSSFHSNYAVARNGVISICGDVDNNRVRDLVEACSSTMNEGEEEFHSIVDAIWPMTPQDVTKYCDKEQAIVIAAVPGIELMNPDRAALDLIEEVCGGMDGRLFMRIREKLGLAYFSGVTQLIGFVRGMMMFYVGTREDAAEKVQEELVSELIDLSTEGITEEELERAKKSYSGKYSLAKQSHSARAQGCALNVLYGLGTNYDELLLKQISELDCDTIGEVAKKYLDTKSLVQVKVLPKSK